MNSAYMWHRIQVDSLVATWSVAPDSHRLKGSIVQSNFFALPVQYNFAGTFSVLIFPFPNTSRTPIVQPVWSSCGRLAGSSSQFSFAILSSPFGELKPCFFRSEKQALRAISSSARNSAISANTPKEQKKKVCERFEKGLTSLFEIADFLANEGMVDHGCISFFCDPPTLPGANIHWIHDDEGLENINTSQPPRRNRRRPCSKLIHSYHCEQRLH